MLNVAAMFKVHSVPSVRQCRGRATVYVYTHLNQLVKVDADILSDLNQSLGLLFN